jgi:hypothetical protein
MGNTMKSASGYYCKTFMAIQRSDQKLWPFSTVIPVWNDKTSYSSSRDSIGNTRKTASGNYCETFMANQRSDQKLWPFSPIIPVWSDKTSNSSSRDSMVNTMKTASGNYCKTFMAIQWSNQKLWPFQLLFRSGATRPPIHRVGIPSVIQGKRTPETSVKLSWRPTVGSKVMDLFNCYSGLERQDLLFIE